MSTSVQRLIATALIPCMLLGSLPLRLALVLALAVALPFTQGRTLLPLARGLGWIAGRIGAVLGTRSRLYQNVTGV